MKLTMATPQETWDHIFGSGSMIWGWYKPWLNGMWGIDRYGDVVPSWQFRITMEDGNDGTVTRMINHDVIVKAAMTIVGNFLLGEKVKYMTEECVRQCANLVFNPDNTDFDSNTADELLQYIMLGGVVFG